MRSIPRPRHDRASQLDAWDGVDELVDEETFSQAAAMGSCARFSKKLGFVGGSWCMRGGSTSARGRLNVL